MKGDRMGLYAAIALVAFAVFLAGYTYITGDFATALLILAIISGLTLLIAVAITYAYSQQSTLLRRVAQILYDKAVTEEEIKEEMKKYESGTFSVERPDIDFDDVVGMEGIKKALRRSVIVPIERPDIYRSYMGSSSASVLLYGPPGCGKTYIARATAGEAKVPLIYIRVSDITSMWFGQSEKNIKKAFEEARKRAPSVLFIDEIDALGGKRDGSMSEGGRRMLTELLVQMENTKDIVVIAATNAPWDLDPALRRSGRFGRKIYVPGPDREARKALFRHYLSNLPTSGIDTDKLASMTEGFAASDIAEACRQAAEMAMERALEKKGTAPVLQRDIEAAIREIKPSIPPWVATARRMLSSTGEREFFSEMEGLLEA